MPRGDGPAASSPTPAAAGAAVVVCTPSSPPPPHTPGQPAGSITAKRMAKRRAAEAALSKRFSGGGPAASLLAAADAAAPLPPSSPGDGVVTVPPCASSADGQPSSSHSWCGHAPVTIHRWAWPALAGGDVTRVPPSTCPSRHHAAGKLTAAIVDDADHLPAALTHLRSSMRDPLISIDLEWSPDRRAGRRGKARAPSPVGLVQLASGSHALLIRVCCFKRRGLPDALSAFLSDPSITIVSFAWDSGDEGKAVATWGRGRRDGLFGSGSFIDAQLVARAMGYARLGLGALAARVLGVALPKCPSVARSDWGAAGVGLSPQQVRYAALDALAAGHLLRGLRLLHAHGGGECPGCAVPVGVVLHGGRDAACGADSSSSAASHTSLPTCGACGSSFVDGQALANHARSTGCGGAGGHSSCEGCGRWVSGGGGGGGGCGGGAEAGAAQEQQQVGRKRKR